VKKLGDFHDGCLEGFWSDDPFVHIFIKISKFAIVDGIERFAIVAHGVLALYGTGFMKGHIVLDVMTKTHEEISSADIRLLYDLREDEAGEEQCRKVILNVRQQKLEVLEITPSYGATLLILAKSFELLDRKKWSESYGSRLAATRLDVTLPASPAPHKKN
jgi:hypothetical protein